MHTDPKVSIIIPVYNAELYMYQCLETILAQTLQEIEIILIDDGSTDSSFAICKEFQKRDARISVYTQNNLGVGETRNRGIQLAHGEYLSFLDADDFFELNMLEKLYRRAIATNADIVFCDYWEFDDKNKKDNILPNKARESLLSNQAVFSAIDYPDIIFQLGTGALWNSLYKRSFIQSKKILCGIEQRSQDALFNREALVLASNISFLDERLLHYRVNIPNSLSNLAEKYQFSVFSAYNKIYNFLKENNLYYTYRKSFLNMLLNISIRYEIQPLKYPFRFFSEYYFIKKIIPEYQLNLLPKNYFYDTDCYKKLKEYIRDKNCFITKKWYRKNKDRIVPIVASIDAKNVYYLGITLQSIIDHMSENRFYDTYVLHEDLTEEIQNKLSNFSCKNFKITFINIKRLAHYYPFFSEKGTTNLNCDFGYFFFIPSLFLYDKIIYLNYDVLIQKDISALYDIPLNNNLIAGVADILSDDEDRIRQGWGMDPYDYINSGVLLINNKLWLKENIQQKCLDELEKPNNSYTKKWQDVVNFVCQDRILLLNFKWNFLVEAYSNKREKYENRVQNLNTESCCIIHYNGFTKPWNSLEITMGELWWKCARNTSIYEIILFRQKQQLLPTNPIPKESLEIKKTLSKDELYQLKYAYIRKALKFLFSFGKVKQQNKLELSLIQEKLDSLEKK